jgi:preprotein translocase subunit SecE
MDGPVQKVGPIQKVTQFLKEVRFELKRVTWPSRKETFAGTMVVLIIVFIAASFLGIVDMGLSELIRMILSN